MHAVVMENELTRVFDALPALLWTALPDGRIDFFNRSWCEYSGSGVDDLHALGWHSLVHPEDLPTLLKRWQSILAAKAAGEIEARLRHREGEYRLFLFRVRPLTDAAGRIVLWFGLGSEIEDRRRSEIAEARLAGEKRLLERVALAHPLPDILDELCRFVEEIAPGCHCSVLLTDPTGTHLKHGAAPSLPTSFNDSIDGRPVNIDSGPCAMAAFLREPVITADIALETRWESYAWRPLALEHGLHACWSTPILSRTRKVLGTFAIYYREPGRPTRFHQNLIDQCTHIASIAIEQAQREFELKRNEACLAEAQRLSVTGSFYWRVATNEVTWSAELYRIFRLDPGPPLTLERIRSRFHPEDIPFSYEIVERMRSDSGNDMEYEHRLLMPDDSVRYVHIVAHPVLDDDGQLAYTGAIQDVTQRRLSEEALNKARSELAHLARVTSLGALTASIAHEVNQPLTGIMTNASTCQRMLTAQPANVAGALETARRMIRDANRAFEVIARLRALFGRKETVTESVELNEAVREVLALSSSDLQRNRVILRTELAENLPPVAGDRVQLQQVVLNLLLNASEAMSNIGDRPRRLTIRTERDDGNRVRVSVQDVGVGIDPQKLGQVFEAFYTTKRSGMGMGLAVSHSIIESHHGRMWATPNEGPGVTFAFAIPRASEESLSVSGFGPIQTRAAAADAQAPGHRR